MLSRCLLNGEKNSESATACGLQRSQTRKRTFSLLTAVVAGNTGWEELQGSKLSSCIHFGHWFTRIFYHILLLRPRPCIFGVTSLRMMSLRLMKKVNFQNCHHSNMYNMHKMNLSSGHSITHYSKLIQPNIQSQGNLFFHFETKYVRPVVCRIARTCVWNFQQMELAGFFNSICKRCLLRWSCQLLVKLLWHAVCIAETTVQFETIKPFLKRFIAGINLRIW